MKRTLLWLTILCFSLATATARVISDKEAARRAIAAIQKSGGVFRLPSNVQPRLIYTGRLGQSQQPTYYVLGGLNGGFVIASADDRALPVLGYADQGEFDIYDMPDNMRDLLDTYSAEIAALDAPAQTDAPRPVRHGRKYLAEGEIKPFVRPLLGKILWDQGKPYNDQCPEVTQNGKKKTCFTGCAATAIAQILRFHQWPVQGVGEHAYRSKTYGLSQHVNFAEHTYDWAHMLENYSTTSYDDTQAQAVATLMHDCGVASDMDYSPVGSGTYNERIAYALINHFDYDSGIQLLEREIYTQKEWDDILRTELSQERPIYITGANDKAGHAFVCDGFDEEGFFHINWGWSGKSNGYFKLTALTPESQGAGGSYAGYNYTQNVIIGIKPQAHGETQKPYLKLGNKYLWASQVADNKYFLWAAYINPTHVPFVGKVGFKVYENGEVINDINENCIDVTAEVGVGNTQNFSFPETYQREGLRYEFFYKRDGEQEWNLLQGVIGAPYTLVSEAQGPFVNYVLDKSEEAVVTVSDIQANGHLYAGKQGKFLVTLTNNTPQEYFGDIRIYAYEPANPSKVYEAPLNIVSVPVGETVDAEFTLALPSTPAVYNFGLYRIAYDSETVPVTRVGETEAAAFALEVKRLINVGLADFVVVDWQNNVSNGTPVSPDAKVTLSANIRNDGGYSEAYLESFVYDTSNRIAYADFAAKKLLLDKGETYLYTAQTELAQLEDGTYNLVISTYAPGDTESFPIVQQAFVVSSQVSGTKTVTLLDNEAQTYDLIGRQVKAEGIPAGAYIRGGKKVLK